MEPRDSTMLESSGEDTMLIETVKSIVTREERDEPETDEDFFLESQVQDEQHSGENFDKAASKKHQTEKMKKEMLGWMHLCRVCANANDRLIPIFEDEGAEHDLSSKILKYLPIHVSENDTLPLQLCYQCAGTLLAWHELSEGCLSAEKRLLEMQDTLQNKQQCYNSTSLDNVKVSASVTTTTSIASNTASLQSDQQVDDKIEVHSAEEINKSNRSCGVRTPFRVSPDTQNAFWKTYRKRCQPRMRDLRKPNAADCGSVWITVTETAHDQPSTMSEQLENNDPLRLSTEAKEKRVATQHFIIDTGNERKKIAIADEESNHRDQIMDDDSAPRSPDNGRDDKDPCETSKGSHKEESFRCVECGKCFKLKDSYLRHMRIHKDERPFTCHVCGKQFRDSGGLTRHLKDVHAKLKNFRCDLCGRSFASKATRDDHRRTHTGERPYVCDSCGKTFKSKASLYIHSKLHTNEFPHACSYCGKRFRRRQEVLAHVTTHTGEKNHTCDVCTKKFRVKSELARHKLIHSEHKPFVCIKCSLAFRQKRYLNNHIKSRHSEFLRPCKPATEKSFAEYRSLRSAAIWANNVTIKYDPTRSSTSIAENTKEISERETRDLFDNYGVLKHDDKTDLNASKCQEKYQSVALRSTSETIKDYTCDNCQRTFRRKYHLIHHLTGCKHRSSINKEDSSSTSVKTTKRKKRAISNSGEKRDSNRLMEYTKDTSSDKDRCRVSTAKLKRKRIGTYSCGYCEHTAQKRKLLNAHLTEAHPDELVKGNRRSFVATETVLSARIEHAGKVYYHCGECGKNLNSPYTFYWHLRIHTGERMFTCHLCGKRFRVNQGLARHLRETHAGIKNVPCDLCGRMFSTRRNVEDHRRIHTGERPYVCNVCGKTFKQKASLFVHNRTHSDVFPFKCSYCEQTFRTRPPLMVHITKHTGEKPHACDVCGRCFRIKYELKRHRLIHSDEKPWRCTDCDLSFRQKRYLVNHRRLNHESPICVTAAK